MATINMMQMSAKLAIVGNDSFFVLNVFKFLNILCIWIALGFNSELSFKIKAN